MAAANITTHFSSKSNLETRQTVSRRWKSTFQTILLSLERVQGVRWDEEEGAELSPGEVGARVTCAGRRDEGPGGR